MIPLKDDAPIERLPVLTLALIAANLLAFGWQIDLLSLPDAFGVALRHHHGSIVDAALAVWDRMGLDLAVSVRRGGVIPFEILELRDIDYRDIVPPPFTILTSMFLHGGVGHLAFNMLFLWIFGNNVEDALGRVRFFLFYLGCGTVAALVQVVASATMGPSEALIPMVGASGAIAGVLAAYLLLYPRARISTLVVIFVFIRVVELPAVFFIGLWFAGQLLSVFFGGNTGVAFFAHIGGFLAGLLLLRIVGRRPRWRADRGAW